MTQRDRIIIVFAALGILIVVGLIVLFALGGPSWPSGTVILTLGAIWAVDYAIRRWHPCPHDHVRCVHGDEMLAVGGRRSQCLDCGRYLRPLPTVCSVTGRPHG